MKSRLGWGGARREKAGRASAWPPSSTWAGAPGVYKSDGCGTIIKVDDYGKVDVFTGSSDIGQGSETVIAQIVAEVLGAAPGRHQRRQQRYGRLPVGRGGAREQDHLRGGQFRPGGCAEDPRADAGDGGRGPRQDPPASISRKASYTRSTIPEKNIALGKVLRNAHYTAGGRMLMAEYFYDPPNENFDREFKGNLSVAYAYGAHGVEVEVDRETAA